MTEMIINMYTDTSAIEKELNLIAANPAAIEVVRQMLPARFKELFATRSELDPVACMLVVYIEPTQLLKSLSATVLN